MSASPSSARFDAPRPNFACRLWRRLLWLTRILIACRVSALSAVAGLLLFGWVEQSQDLFADISFGVFPTDAGSVGLWSFFFFALFFVWAFPVHYAARRALEDDGWIMPWSLRGESPPPTDIRERYRREILWTPRLLGLVPFVAVWRGLTRADEIVLQTLALTPSAAAHAQISALTLTTAAGAGAFLIFVLFRRHALRAAAPYACGLLSDARLELVAHLSLAVSTAMFLGAYLFPFVTATTAPRAVVVPFVLGNLTLVAAFLARRGARLGFPLLEAVIALTVLATSFNDKFNALRTIANQPPATNARQIDMDKAIEAWKSANHCVSGACPRALIVAIDGGASRAAFAAATALGYLFDHTSDGADPARRLFALSGVSGGAFGAATIRTALVEAQKANGLVPPCRSAPRTWFAPHGADVTASWRSCLQALVAGDYLTPAFIGLGFRDNLAPGYGNFSLLTDDRAALVERAFEYHFDHVLKPPVAYPAEVIEAATRFTPPDGGLAGAFGYIVPAPGAWTPLLLLNGSSVNQGTRIIASEIKSTRAAQDKARNSREALYPAALDLFEMLSTPCAPDKIEGASCASAHDGRVDLPQVRDGDDIRLSTAAMMSARFPVVSPPGVIRSKTDVQAGDRVVDGGYFENSGLTSAMDIATALHAQGVTPIVLEVQNDPTSSAGDFAQGDGVDAFPPRAAGTPHDGRAMPAGFDLLVLLQRFFAVIAAPFDTLAATRNGHALEAATAAQSALQQMSPQPDQPSFFTFRVYKLPRFAPPRADEEPGLSEACTALAGKKMQMSQVSMSWWLSQSVQAEIDSQLCDARNASSLGDLLTRLAKPAPAPRP